MRRLTHALLALGAGVGAALAPLTTAADEAAGGQGTAPEPTPDLPNIVLITTDDQGRDDLRFMPLTRRLLGDEGVTFSDAVAPFPLCCPARATLLTGQLAHNHGVLSNKAPAGGYDALRPLEDRTLPVWLQEQGYRTTFTGKYLNGYGHPDQTEIPPGWDNWYGAVARVYDFYANVVNENGTVTDRAGAYQADLTQDVTEQAIRDGADTGRPFFVFQSNLAPHAACPRGPGGGCRWSPPQPAAQDAHLYPDLPLRRHPGYDERANADKPDFVARRAALTRREHNRMLSYHRDRARSLRAVDRNVRDTVRLLADVGELDNTLLIFASDNGFLLGEHRLFAKTLAYEPSLGIPLLMRGPGVPAGVTVDEMVSLVDIPATVADAARATPLLELDGRSLLPVAAGAPGYAAVGIEAGAVAGARPGQFFYHGVRTARYTYVEYPLTGEAELYDRLLDPGQVDNAAYRPTHRATRTALRRLLARLRFCTGTACTTVAGEIPAPRPPQGPVHPDELTTVGDATQVVTVTATSWSARAGRAVAWQKSDRSWRAVRSFPVHLGTRGLARPGAVVHLRGRTPVGAFRTVRAFGLRDNPGTSLPFRQVGVGHRWVFDQASPATYNVLQPRRPATAAWRPAYEVRFAGRPRAFRHAVVLNHNLPTQVRRAPRRGYLVAARPAQVSDGSLLLHTGTPVGDQGWVAAGPRRVAWLLRWMQPRTEGTVFVVGPEAYLRNRL